MNWTNNLVSLFQSGEFKTYDWVVFAVNLFQLSTSCKSLTAKAYGILFYLQSKPRRVWISTTSEYYHICSLALNILRLLAIRNNQHSGRALLAAMQIFDWKMTGYATCVCKTPSIPIYLWDLSNARHGSLYFISVWW